MKGVEPTRAMPPKEGGVGTQERGTQSMLYMHGYITHRPSLHIPSEMITRPELCTLQATFFFNDYYTGQNLAHSKQNDN